MLSYVNKNPVKECVQTQLHTKNGYTKLQRQGYDDDEFIVMNGIHILLV
jgi:hypothetical protein